VRCADVTARGKNSCEQIDISLPRDIIKVLFVICAVIYRFPVWAVGFITCLWLLLAAATAYRASIAVTQAGAK
jgi:hypothetical protein